MAKKTDSTKTEAPSKAAPKKQAKPAAVASVVTPSAEKVTKPGRATKAAAPKAAAATKAATKEVKPVSAAKPAKAAVQTTVTISREEIATRAYFISEKRRAEGLPGNDDQDWLEAERQLSSEAAPKS